MFVACCLRFVVCWGLLFDVVGCVLFLVGMRCLLFKAVVVLCFVCLLLVLERLVFVFSRSSLLVVVLVVVRCSSVVVVGLLLFGVRCCVLLCVVC